MESIEACIARVTGRGHGTGRSGAIVLARAVGGCHGHRECVPKQTIAFLADLPERACSKDLVISPSKNRWYSLAGSASHR